MHKLFSAVVIMMSLRLLSSPAYEVSFDTSGYTGSTPNGWEWVGSANTQLMGLAAPKGSSESGLGFNLLFEDGTKTLRTTSTVVDASNIVCDNVSASVRVYMQGKTDSGINSFQVVISTNNWATYETIGDPIEIEEAGRTVNEWVTVDRRKRVEGLAASGNDVSVGVLVTARNTLKFGYLKSIEFCCSRHARECLF